MRQSVITGQQLYKEIDSLKSEVSELWLAADSVIKQMGEDSAAYTALAKTAKEKEKELNAMYCQKFTPYQQDRSAFEYKGGY